MSSTDAHAQDSLTTSGPVIYHRGDYVGFLRRLVIWVVDCLVLFIFLVQLAVLDALFGFSASGTLSPLATLLMIAFSWCYLAVLKPSRIRTPGYWIADAKIVTIHGLQPSPFRMTLRLLWMLMWLFGWPITVFLDCLWPTMDDERQMLRDLFTETRLIRNSARPAAVGRVMYSLYNVSGLTLLYASIRVRESATTTSSDALVLPIAEPTALPDINVVTATMESRDFSIVLCPRCGTTVVPKSNGRCPSCQARIVGGF